MLISWIYLIFINHFKVPTDKKVTYASFVCDHRPLKDETWRIRLVVGGDKLPYNADSGSPATDLLETKILTNSVLSDARKYGAKCLSMDLKDMFLHTPMKKSTSHSAVDVLVWLSDLQEFYVRWDAVAELIRPFFRGMLGPVLFPWWMKV